MSGAVKSRTPKRAPTRPRKGVARSSPPDPAAHEIIRREEAVNDVRWRLEDPFFAAWLAKAGALPIGA